MNFEEAWDYIFRRSMKAGIPVVQDKVELEYVFNLLKDCKSYLEIGTAEGNSLFVLANAMPKGSEITYVDYGEKHTTPHRNEIIGQLTDYKITEVLGDSNDYSTFPHVFHEDIDKSGYFDMILIDAGHDDFNVAIDAFLYGHRAKKYVVFHDVQLPDVNRAYEWYCRQMPKFKNYRVVNSETFGYGIIECQSQS